jgi:hypothetical protein
MAEAALVFDRGAALPLPLDRATVRDIVAAGIKRYIADRRQRVPAFVDRNFSLAGALRIHRHALGLDLVRAPINVAASLATVGKSLSAHVLRRLGQRELAAKLSDLDLFLATDVGREIDWLIRTELLELPSEAGARRSERDALAEAIVGDPRLVAHFDAVLRAIGERADDAAFRRKAEDAMTAYSGSRAAASDIVASLLSAAVGAAVCHQFTPGIATLSGAVAGAITHKAAVSGFVLGPWLGKVWYGAFAVSKPPLLYAGVFAGMLVPLAALTAFAGVVADPVQRALGLHRRRLEAMIDVLEIALSGDDARLLVRDHYVARVFDLIDWTYVLLRLARS